jgi:hypothetical protein
MYDILIILISIAWVLAFLAALVFSGILWNFDTIAKKKTPPLPMPEPDPPIREKIGREMT